jgi:hypothetical protein
MERIALLAEGAGNFIVWAPSHARRWVSIYDKTYAVNRAVNWAADLVEESAARRS